MDNSLTDASKSALATEAWHQLAACLREADLDALEIESPGSLVRMVRHIHDYQPQVVSPEAASPPSALQPVSAPCAGVFRAQHPWAPGWAAGVGEAVRAGDRVGYVQVAYLVLPVTVHRAGVVASVDVADGTLVGYGTALVHLQEDANDGH
jgi:biotin carboxyl carrier protein